MQHAGCFDWASGAVSVSFMLLVVLPLRLSSVSGKPSPLLPSVWKGKPLPGPDSPPAHVTQIEQPVKACRYSSALEAEMQLQDEWKWLLKDCGHKWLWKHGYTTMMEKASLEKAHKIY